MPQVEFKIVEKTQEFYENRRVDEKQQELQESINEQTKLLQKSLTDINSNLETKIEKNFKNIEDTRRNLEKLKEQDGNELKRLSMLLTDIESGVARKD
jgi:septal ring factor EnvC (AmiA/AmiB activator)